MLDGHEACGTSQPNNPSPPSVADAKLWKPPLITTTTTHIPSPCSPSPPVAVFPRVNDAGEADAAPEDPLAYLAYLASNDAQTQVVTTYLSTSVPGHEDDDEIEFNFDPNALVDALVGKDISVIF